MKDACLLDGIMLYYIQSNACKQITKGNMWQVPELLIHYY